jgi:hypothetical protein
MRPNWAHFKTLFRPCIRELRQLERQLKGRRELCQEVSDAGTAVFLMN